MAGKEFTGKDKTVQKMTRDGLTEENLHDGSVKNISKLDREGRPSKSFEMSLDHRHVNTASEDSAGKRNKKYRDKSGLAAEERIRSRDAPVDQMDIGPEENGVDGVGTEEAGTGRASQRSKKPRTIITCMNVSGCFPGKGFPLKRMIPYPQRRGNR